MSFWTALCINLRNLGFAALLLCSCSTPVDIEFGPPIETSNAPAKDLSKIPFHNVSVKNGALNFWNLPHDVKAANHSSICKLGTLEASAAAISRTDPSSILICGTIVETGQTVVLKTEVDWSHRPMTFSQPTILYEGDELKNVTDLADISHVDEGTILWDFGQMTLFALQADGELTPILNDADFPELNTKRALSVDANRMESGKIFHMLQFNDRVQQSRLRTWAFHCRT